MLDGSDGGAVVDPETDILAEQFRIQLRASLFLIQQRFPFKNRFKYLTCSKAILNYYN